MWEKFRHSRRSPEWSTSSRRDVRTSTHSVEVLLEPSIASVRRRLQSPFVCAEVSRAPIRFVFLNVLKEAASQYLAASSGWPWENWVDSSAGTYLVAMFDTSYVSPNFLDSLSLTLRSVTLGIIRAAAAVVPAYRVIRPDSYEAIRKDE